jgi:S1-C subfamily serine protease
LPDAPALNSALQTGDIIVALNEQMISGIDDLYSKLRDDLIGEYISLTVLRLGYKIDVRVMPGEIGE